MRPRCCPCRQDPRVVGVGGGGRRRPGLVFPAATAAVVAVAVGVVAAVAVAGLRLVSACMHVDANFRSQKKKEKLLGDVYIVRAARGRSLAYFRAAVRRGMECTREEDENNGDEEEQRKPWVPAAGSVIHGA